MSESEGKARHCFAENPAVYGAAGATPGQALRRLGKHPHLRRQDWAHGSVVLSQPGLFGDDQWTATLYIG